MANLPVPDYATLQSWLQQFDIDYYHCGHCEGLHLPILQEQPAVFDGKVEIEGDFVWLSTSIELKPTGVMHAFAHMSQLNSHFPTVKIFVEMVDESLPRILLLQHLARNPGISQQQFEFFVRDGIDQMSQAIATISELKLHFVEDGAEEITIETAPVSVLMH